MLTPEEMQQFLAEHGADPDMQFMINPYSKENPYHNRNYASEEEIKEIQ